MNDQAFQLLKAQLDRLEAKVDQLFAFKWQIIGGSTILSLVLTILINFYFTKGG